MNKKIILLLDEILIFVLQKVNKLHLNILNKNDVTNTKYKFLTANDNAENIEEYSLALNEALEDKKVKNIAISGSYGSGKSSFIE
jgi:DNA replication protein DnaC